MATDVDREGIRGDAPWWRWRAHVRRHTGTGARQDRTGAGRTGAAAGPVAPTVGAVPSDDETTVAPGGPEVSVQRLTDLSDESAAVRDLVAAARAADGGEPLSEDTRLVVDGAGRTGVDVQHLLARAATGSGSDGGRATPLTGYAQVRSRAGSEDGETTVELLVAPTARRAGVGAALAGAVADVVTASSDGRHGTLTAWSHGDHPGAAALARRHGLERERELWRMERAMDDEADPLPPLELPDGVALRAFEPDRDDAGWLALNAAAFADHPEQGAWGPDDLAARTRAPWFDPADLLLLVDTSDPGRLLASHWTKVEGPLGEVYVVAVAPAAQGRGLGGAVVLAGLHHLARRGVGRVELYVGGNEADARARRLYERLGFARASTDVAYHRRW